MTAGAPKVAIDKSFNWGISAVLPWRHITGRVQIQQYEESIDRRLGAVQSPTGLTNPPVKGVRARVVS